MKLKTVFVNAGVLLASTLAGLALCEAGSRLVLNPADYLGVRLVKHDVLGAAMPPGRPGFDKWGFRNRAVPQSAEIVALGDSHTYGNTARMEESWPSVLGRLSGRSVYNMGMGGYGPNQYYYLLTTKAVTLKPKVVICGLYLGDDFENAFTITHGLDHWAYLREGRSWKVDSDIWGVTAPGMGPQKTLRVWLSEHSVLYQLLLHSSSLGRFEGQVRIKTASASSDSITTLIVPEKDIVEAFLPKPMLTRLDQDSPYVREGMRITFRLLRDMDQVCRDNRIRFLVVVIPTKEMVFSDFLEHNATLNLNAVIDKLLVNERLAMQETFRALNDRSIPYVDALPALKRSVQNELYARTVSDMHPGKNGYRVIAQAVFDALKQQKRD
jgi:hypothetical protein